MFSTVGKSAESGKPPTAYELGRLRQQHFNQVLSSLVLESFATLSDVAFVVILYDLAFAMHLDNSWYALGVRACGNVSDAENAYFASAFLQLAVLSSVLLVVRVLFRGFTAGWQIFQNRKRLVGSKAWVVASLGALVTMLDPLSGSVLIESQLTHLEPQVLEEYKKMLNELRADWIMLLLDTFPHFTIQVAYAVMASENANYDLSPAWFVATITTCIKMLSQLQEVIYLQSNFAVLKRLSHQVHLRIGHDKNNPSTIFTNQEQRNNARGYDENM
ncbi:hypothetical protein BASA81_006783 [Batrachochytrium salamandrivorans]|nr:hypothetical protein BASA81_006783 [Batrachochytrium salamandrivorans]